MAEAVWTINTEENYLARLTKVDMGGVIVLLGSVISWFKMNEGEEGLGWSTELSIKVK